MIKDINVRAQLIVFLEILKKDGNFANEVAKRVLLTEVTSSYKDLPEKDDILPKLIKEFFSEVGQPTSFSLTLNP